jgi:hypothetical protein
MLDNTEREEREIVTVAGEAQNVLIADAEAWELLETVLGRDPVGAWYRKSMKSVVKGRGYIEYVAEFERDPSVEVPPVQPRQMTDAELDALVKKAKAEDKKGAKA